MKTTHLVRTFLTMPGCVNPALLKFLWGQEADKAAVAEEIKAIVTEHAAKVRVDLEHPDDWAYFVADMMRLDQIFQIGLVDLAKAKIREAYRYVCGEKGDPEFIANWVVMLAEIELQKEGQV